MDDNFIQSATRFQLAEKILHLQAMLNAEVMQCREVSKRLAALANPINTYDSFPYSFWLGKEGL